MCKSCIAWNVFTVEHNMNADIIEVLVDVIIGVQHAYEHIWSHVCMNWLLAWSLPLCFMLDSCFSPHVLCAFVCVSFVCVYMCVRMQALLNQPHMNLLNVETCDAYKNCSELNVFCMWPYFAHFYTKQYFILIIIWIKLKPTLFKMPSNHLICMQKSITFSYILLH